MKKVIAVISGISLAALIGGISFANEESKDVQTQNRDEKSDSKPPFKANSDGMEMTMSDDAWTQSGFDGNEFDSVVIAYAARGEFHDRLPSSGNWSYTLQARKVVATGYVYYAVRLDVDYYGWDSGSWRNYDSATRKGGEKLEIIWSDHDIESCSPRKACTYIFTERIRILVPKEDFFNELTFQLRGSNLSYIFTIPKDDAARVQEIADENFPNF